MRLSSAEEEAGESVSHGGVSDLGEGGLRPGVHLSQLRAETPAGLPPVGRARSHARGEPQALEKQPLDHRGTPEPRNPETLSSSVLGR